MIWKIQYELQGGAYLLSRFKAKKNAKTKRENERIDYKESNREDDKESIREIYFKN